MVHEMAHLKWFARAPPKPDPIGYLACAKEVYSKTKGKTGEVDWQLIKCFAHSLAWYAQYHYWNNMEFCANEADRSCIDV